MIDEADSLSRPLCLFVEEDIMKRFFTILIAIIVLALTVMPLAASAAEMTEPNYIYFEIPTATASWKNFSMVYCHMWSKDGGDIYPWQSKNEKCEDMGNGYWRYDLSAIEFDPAKEYSLIFSNEAGMQTYNLNITSSCLGDIAYCSGDTCVNPVDGEKSCAVARWKNNGEKVHPAIEVDSNGRLLNVDNVKSDEIETVWGDSKGASYELPELQTSNASSITASESPTEDDGEVVEDGINTKAATVWIVSISAVVIISLLVVTVILARRNRK